jgi:TonB family protein
MQEKVAHLTVWTRKRSITRHVSENSATEIRDLLACFYSAGGANTFPRQPGDGKIFTLVEVQPEYRGGVKAMLEFIKKNLRYPASARRTGAQGTVYAQFLVNKDGSLSDIRTIEGVHPALDAEAERVIKLMPPWKPGHQKGKPVTVRFVMPVKFKL